MRDISTKHFSDKFCLGNPSEGPIIILPTLENCFLLNIMVTFEIVLLLPLLPFSPLAPLHL